MTSSIKGRISEDMKTALRNQEKERLAAIRLILAAIKQREIDERITLTDEQSFQVLDKMIKQRRESITQYQNGNRQDLADKEEAEIKIIQDYLPPQLSENDIATLVNDAIKETNAISIRDMGKVMGILKPKIQGRADMGVVSNKIKERLS